MRMGNEMLYGTIKVRVPEQKGLSAAQTRSIRESFNKDDGDVPPYVRFRCHIAEAANAAVANGVYSNGRYYEPNPKVPAQFGKNARNQAYLTLGLVDPETGEKVTVSWTGDDVPAEMVRVGVLHDNGENAPAVTISVKLQDAQITQPKTDKRKRHDVNGNGEPHPRNRLKAKRNHNRLSQKDFREREARRDRTK